MNFQYFESPVGKLRLLSNGSTLCAIEFENRHQTRPSERETSDRVLRNCAAQLREYFEQGRRYFDLPLSTGGTDFQRNVWRALVRIPYGEVRSYRDIAIAIDRPRAVRAVGAANGRNPLPIVVPCHRVIGSNGALTGFAGGLDVKTRLLQLEGVL